MTEREKKKILTKIVGCYESTEKMLLSQIGVFLFWVVKNEISTERELEKIEKICREKYNLIRFYGNESC